MRLIDANKLKKHYSWYYNKELIDAIVDRQKTIDAVPVIRCKDCKYYRKDRFMCDLTKYACTENDFCSWAEREEHETD